MKAKHIRCFVTAKTLILSEVLRQEILQKAAQISLSVKLLSAM